MPRLLIFLFVSILIIAACKKENDNPQWDVAVLGPLLHATLTMEQMIGDTSIAESADGAQILDFDTIISDFGVDSIYQIADTSFKTINLSPGFPLTIQPGQSFIPNSNIISLGVGGLNLRRAIISKGKIRLEIKNTLRSKVDFTYSIPLAKKNGQSLTIFATVDSGSTSDPKYLTRDIDFAGYDLDLTGSNGNHFNRIEYLIEANAHSPGFPFVVPANDTLVNLKTSLIGISPSFVLGYLGQQSSNESTIRNIGIGGLIKSGTVLIDSVKLKLDIINYIGADAQLYVNSLTSLNNRTGTSLNLNAPAYIQHSLNINRASRDTNLPDPVIPSHYPIVLDNSNSNIRDLIENIPDKITYDLDLSLNPLGNISGNNDFIYSDRLISTRIGIVMPLRFAFNQLLLADTLPFTINNTTDFDPIGDAILSLIADNGFPIDLNVQLFLVDTFGTVTDSLLIPDLIAGAPYDANYRATGMQRTIVKIPIDAERKNRLLGVKQVGLRIKFNTPDYPQPIQFYSDYKLEIKIVADGIYSIR